MSGIPFAFEIDGKAVDPNDVEDPAEAAMLRSIMASVADRVEDIYCKEHNEGPHFVCTGTSYDDLNLEVLGCCDALVEQVQKRLSDSD